MPSRKVVDLLLKQIRQLKIVKRKLVNMKYNKLGRTGLHVSTICLGTMIYGRQVPEAEAIRIIEEALNCGINFLDTADVYAGGDSERIVSKAVRGKRHSTVLATKVGLRTGSSPTEAGLSRNHITEGLEASLRRLDTDYVDVYYVHIPDYDTPIEETLRTLDSLIHQGKIRYIGCSNFRAWQICKALWVSDINDLVRFDCTQPPYNLITRDLEYELLPLCASEGIGVCVYNPLAGGLLTGKHSPDRPPSPGTRFALSYTTAGHPPTGQIYSERYWSDTNFKAVARFKLLADAHGCTLAQFALAWVLSNRTITSAISSASSVSQLEENLSSIDIDLSPEDLALCDEVWQELRPDRFSYGI